MQSGVARWMGEFARRAPPRGLIVSTGMVPGAEDPDRGVPQAVDRLPLPVRRLSTVQGLMLWSHRAALLARSKKVPFVWCGQVKPAGYPALWIHSRQKTPYGIIVHGTDLLTLQHKVDRSGSQRRAARSLLAGARLFVANSRYTGELLRRVLTGVGLPDNARPIHVVPLGTDPDHFRPGIDPRAMRKKYGLGTGRWIMTVTRLVADRGMDAALSAIAALGVRFPEVRFAVVGSGEKQAEVEALATRMGLGDRVKFLGDVPHADLPALLNGAELYLHVARDTDRMVEGFGMSVVEASACGIPVVAGNSGGVVDAIRDGETGMLVDHAGLPAGAAPSATTATALVGALDTLLASRDLRARLGAGGRRAVEQHYNWERVVREMLALQREATSPGPA
jgi:phosphatidylinositol alpha-1,6-mannosyltransferase